MMRWDSSLVILPWNHSWAMWMTAHARQHNKQHKTGGGYLKGDFPGLTTDIFFSMLVVHVPEFNEE